MNSRDGYGEKQNKNAILRHRPIPHPKRYLCFVILVSLLLSSFSGVEGWTFLPSAACHRSIRLSSRSNVSLHLLPNRHDPSFLNANTISSYTRNNILKIRGGGGNNDGSKQKSASSATGTTTTTLFREMIAEFIGTYMIVLIGTGSVMSAIYTSSLVGLFQVASVWSIGVTAAICTTSSVSGAHLNPAVSVSLAMFRSFPVGKIIPYVLAPKYSVRSSPAPPTFACTLALYRSSKRSIPSSDHHRRESTRPRRSVNTSRTC